MISVLILTKDEANILPLALAAVAFSDDVVVLDSGSTDGTVELARAAGARVFQRPWDTEPAQRRYSLTLPFRHPWVFNPDADEVPDGDLAAEMLRVTDDPARPEVLYRVRRRDMFLGRWLRRSSLYPTWFPRLFRPDKVRFERQINMAYLADGPEGRLTGHLTHYSFNKGLDAWYAKHNHYSTLEAVEALAVRRGRRVALRPLIGRDAVARRRAMKDLSFRLPYRPTLRFLYSYVWRLGVLDGWAGLKYCQMMAQYEAMIGLKVHELERRELGLPL